LTVPNCMASVSVRPVHNSGYTPISVVKYVVIEIILCVLSGLCG
jgi:hypothetical protein